MGYYNQTQQDNINWNGDTDTLIFDLVPYPPNSGYIEVNVNDIVSLSPISSAFVQVTNMSSGLVVDTGYTNSAGFYNITGLYIGLYEVTVSKVGYYNQTQQDNINWKGDTDTLIFDLVPYPPNSGYIEVQVNDSITHNPISNAIIECFYSNNNTLFVSGFTDNSGFYNITSLPKELWYIVNVSKAGYHNQTQQDYIAWNGYHNYLNFLLLIVPDSISIISPIHSDLWEISSVYSISWSSIGSFANILIELYENGIFILEITESTPNDGLYLWTLPPGLDDSTLFQIKVIDANNKDTYNVSESFEIKDLRTIIVTSPTSSSYWIMENNYYINWTSTGTIASIKIELYASSILVLEIAASTPNDGAFLWSIPNTLINYTEYVIKVSDLIDPIVFDDSNLFTITGVTDEGGIPGYDVLILGGLLGVVSLVIIKRKRKKLSIS